jgi:hypothetical protein
MARNSLNDSDYQNEATKKDLELVGHAPVSVFDKATWKCIRCGKIMSKSYRAVKYGKYGCRCQSMYKQLPAEDYHTLAKELGIEWVGEEAPEHHRAYTSWKGKTGLETVLPYSLLKKGEISHITKMILGLEDDYAQSTGTS